MTVDREALFWAKVDTTGECWLWTAGVRRDGYGTFWMPGFTPSGRVGAHRAAWFFQHGQLPPSDVLLCHSCDNPTCVRPSHLFTGTNDTNMRDMVAKGRHGNQKKSCCRNGHEFSESNTHTSATGKRSCRLCNAARSRAYKQRKGQA